MYLQSRLYLAAIIAAQWSRWQNHKHTKYKSDDLNQYPPILTQKYFFTNDQLSDYNLHMIYIWINVHKLAFQFAISGFMTLTKRSDGHARRQRMYKWSLQLITRSIGIQWHGWNTLPILQKRLPLLTPLGPLLSTFNPLRPGDAYKSLNWVTSCLDNGLSPIRRQAIIWSNTVILLIETFGSNFSEISIEIHTFSFKKMHLKMSSGKWLPICLGLNVLIPLLTQIMLIDVLSVDTK